MANVDFDYADFSQLALIGARFENCSFRNVNFSGCDLSMTRFLNCDLYNTDFRRAILYTTWFHGCNLTKSNFAGSYLLGFRAKDVDITKAYFDLVPAVGAERKPVQNLGRKYLRVSLGERLPEEAIEVERRTHGVFSADTGECISFKTVGPRDIRFYLRIAETAKYLKRIHSENSYTAQADEYHVVEKRSRRRARRKGLKGRTIALLDLIFGDYLWRYGTSIIRPVAALFLVALIAAAGVLGLPALDPRSGFVPKDESLPLAFEGWTMGSLNSLARIYYHFITLPIGASEGELTGWSRIIVVLAMLAVLALTGLILEAAFSRLGKNT